MLLILSNLFLLIFYLLNTLLYIIYGFYFISSLPREGEGESNKFLSIMYWVGLLSGPVWTSLDWSGTRP
jgi:hypothetical protein